MEIRIVEQCLRFRIYTKDLNSNKEHMYSDDVYESIQKIEEKMKSIKEHFGNDLKLHYDLYWKDEKEIHYCKTR